KPVRKPKVVQSAAHHSPVQMAKARAAKAQKAIAQQQASRPTIIESVVNEMNATKLPIVPSQRIRWRSPVDEKPPPNMETRILRDAARQRISEIIGPYFMDATAMVDGDLVRNKDERPIRFKIWAPHRKIAIERLPKGVAANDPPSC